MLKRKEFNSKYKYFISELERLERQYDEDKNNHDFDRIQSLNLEILSLYENFEVFKVEAEQAGILPCRQ